MDKYPSSNSLQSQYSSDKSGKSRRICDVMPTLDDETQIKILTLISQASGESQAVMFLDPKEDCGDEDDEEDDDDDDDDDADAISSSSDIPDDDDAGGNTGGDAGGGGAGGDDKRSDESDSEENQDDDDGCCNDDNCNDATCCEVDWKYSRGFRNYFCLYRKKYCGKPCADSLQSAQEHYRDLCGSEKAVFRNLDRRDPNCPKKCDPCGNR